MQKAVSHIGKYLKWYILLSLIVTSILVWSSVFHESRNGVLKFVVLDVGQGDALYIESPTGVQVIVDGGPNRNLAKVISDVMPWYDRHVDLLVVTNPDADHYEGFISFLNKYKVDALLEPGTTNKYSAYKVFEDNIAEKGIPKMLARTGQKIDLGGGAYLLVLFPDRDVSGLSSNDGSIVMKLIYGETRVMLQGDSTAKIETHLLNKVASSTLASTILKVGHHGSRTSSTFGYVKTVSPKWAVVSSGLNNDYNHPHKETLDTLQELRVPTYSTCNNGSIFFKSDGKIFTFENKNLREVVVGCKL